MKTILLTLTLVLSQISFANDYNGDPNVAPNYDGVYSDPNIKLGSRKSASGACVECHRSGSGLFAETAVQKNPDNPNYFEKNAEGTDNKKGP